MKSINTIECPNILRRSEYINDVHEHCLNVVSNMEDGTFQPDIIKEVESLLSIKEENILEEKMDDIDDEVIEHMIQFCEKYRIPDLLEALRKYYAEIVIPSLKGMEDLGLLYHDPVSEKIEEPDSYTVQDFLGSMDWFLRNT